MIILGWATAHPFYKERINIMMNANLLATTNVPTTNSIVEPKKIHYKYCKIQRVLYGFIDMDVLVVRVTGLCDYKNIRSAYGSYYSSIKKLKLPIRVSTRKGEMFLIRTDKKSAVHELNTNWY